MLELDGKQLDVLIKDISYNSMKRQIEEIDFQALVSGEKVHSVAEVVLLNHDKVTTGVLQQNLQEIPFKAVPAALVEKVEIDASRLRVGDVIKVKDLAIASDPDVDLLADREEIVVMLLEAEETAEEAEVQK